MHTQTPDAPRSFLPALRDEEGHMIRGFLPRLFSFDYCRAEFNVYTYADRYLPDYDGAEWEFVALPNTHGGGFMMPSGDEWEFYNPDNRCELTVSAGAAGIIITALVLNHRSWMYDRNDEPDLCKHYILRHRQLMEYALEHPESNAIFRALD